MKGLQGKTTWKDALSHGLLALLYGLGLLWTLLGVLELPAQMTVATAVTAGTALLLLLCHLPGWLGWGAGMACAGAGLLWGFSEAGSSMVIQAVRGMTLHLTGVPAALPLVAQETALLLAVLCGVTGFLLTLRSAGAYPAAALVMAVLMLLWMGDRAALLMWLLPAVLVVMALLATSVHEGLRLRRVLPMMTVITLIACAAIPTGGVTVQPLKDAADRIRQRIYDYLFFTESRDVFSLALEGYYPQGRSQLGGKPNPSEQEVMEVQTPRRTYLRGVIKNEYTGRAWVDTIGGRRYLWASLRWRDNRSTVFDMTMPGGAAAENSLLQPTLIAVRMLRDSTSTMFVPQRIRELSPGGDLVPYFNNSSEVFATRNLQAGDTWTVLTPLARAGDAGMGPLLQACALTADDRYADIVDLYTALPSHLQRELYDLALQVTQHAETPYDKALALQTYLSLNYRYTLDVAPQPTELDFVTNFLLRTKEGYCTYFASALTVLCRMIGLPARYVEGYVAVPDASGRAIVTGMDGHAWTEVYFAGFGWLTFDATPWSSGPATQQSDAPPEDTGAENQPTPSPEPQPTPTPEPEMPDDAPPESAPTPELTTEQNFASVGDKLPPWWMIASALLFLLLLALLGRMLWTQPGAKASRAKNDDARWMVWMQAVHDALYVLGLKRAGHESIMAYMRRLDATTQLPVRLSALGEDAAVAFYSRSGPDAAAVAEARRVYAAIIKRFSPWKKLRLTLRRTFLPARKLDFTRIS